MNSCLKGGRGKKPLREKRLVSKTEEPEESTVLKDQGGEDVMKNGMVTTPKMTKQTESKVKRGQ